jgi:hypothetical protein
MYLLDANVFITAKNVHYDFAVVPGFWDWIDQAVTDRQAVSIDRVQTELRAQQDALSDWVHTRASMFRRSTDLLAPALGRIAAWATAQPQYEAAALATFLDSADYYLVAHALTFGDTVVTHEVPAPTARKRVKIPDACRGVGVDYVNPFTMLRSERARFELAAA